MKIRLLLPLIGLAIGFTGPTFAQQQKSLKELIVGTWLLDSVYDQTQDGEKHNPWGDGVKGQAIYTSDGHFSWMIMSANRPKADTSPRIPVGQAIAHWAPTRSMRRQKITATAPLFCAFQEFRNSYLALNNLRQTR